MKSSVEVRRPSTQAVAKIGGLRHAGLGRPTYMPSLALATYLLLVGCTDSSSNNDVATESARQPVPVQVAQVELTTLRPELDLVGTMIALPEQTAMVSPQVGGWVEKLAVVEGQTVSAGDLLVQLDARAARTDVERATAILAEKESAVHRLQRGYLPQEIETERQDRDKARAAVDGLRGELVALDELLKRREISPVAYETKAKALTAAEAALASADAHLQLLQQGTAAELIDEAQALRDVAKADLEHAQLLLEWCSITSPIDGVVVQLSAHQGQFFDRAVPLATVVDMSNLFVQLRISSRKFSAVRLETPVIVQLDSFPGREFHGHVARISGQADPMTGNVVVFALVENDDHMLRPGLNCQARVSLPAIPDALAIPLAAVADNSGTPVVTCIRESKAYETEVELGVEDGDLVQVIHGLALGDTVATSGGYGLPPGTPIEVSPKTASE